MIVKILILVFLCLSMVHVKCEDRSNQTGDGIAVIKSRPTSMQFMMSEERATNYFRQLAKRVPKFVTSMFGSIRFYARSIFNAYTFYAPELGFGKCFYDVMSLRYPTTMRSFTLENAYAFVSNSYDRITSSVAKYVDNVRREELFSDERIDAKIADFGEADMQEYQRKQELYHRIYDQTNRKPYVWRNMPTTGNQGGSYHRFKRAHSAALKIPTTADGSETTSTNKPPTWNDKVQLNATRYARQYNISPQQLQELMYLQQQQQQQQYQQLPNYNQANYNSHPQIESAALHFPVSNGNEVIQTQGFNNVNNNVIGQLDVNEEETPSLNGCLQSYAMGFLWRVVENLLGG